MPHAATCIATTTGALAHKAADASALPRARSGRHAFDYRIQSCLRRRAAGPGSAAGTPTAEFTKARKRVNRGNDQ
jgi:hypothetical protein